MEEYLKKDKNQKKNNHKTQINTNIPDKSTYSKDNLCPEIIVYYQARQRKSKKNNVLKYQRLYIKVHPEITYHIYNNSPISSLSSLNNTYINIIPIGYPL